MTIHALSTVYDIVPGPWETLASIKETSMRGFLEPIRRVTTLVHTEGLHRAGGQMNAGLFAVHQHAQATLAVYRFDQLPSEEWAIQANAIFLTDDGLHNIDGEDLLAPENQYSVPYHPDARMRASRIRADLGVAGIRVLDDLPPIRCEKELLPRSGVEAARRICALIAISEIAIWWHRGDNIVPQVADALPDAFRSFSRQENAFISLVEAGDRSDKTMYEAMQLSWSSKAAQPLAFLLGALEIPAHMRGRAAPRLNDLAYVHDSELIPHIVDMGSEAFVAQFNALAGFDVLCDFYEYVRSLRWVASDETLRPEDHHFIDDTTASTLLEWHKAFSWLLNPIVDWDHVETHT